MGGGAKNNFKKKQRKLRLSFHETPLRPRGQRELSTYRRAGVHHSQETRGTHKTDTKRGEKEESRERKRLNSQDTKHTTKRKAVNTTTNTIMMRNDTLFFGREQ